MQNIEKIAIPIIHENQIPLAILNSKIIPEKGLVLAGDIGGTKTNLALYQIDKGQLVLKKENAFKTKNFKSFLAIFYEFIENDSTKIDIICLGIAGPVVSGKVQGTNFPWEINSDAIAKELKINTVVLINDMEANAYGLAALTENDFETLKYGSSIPGNIALISPGTGLGEAGLFWDGTYYHPFASEGGHCDYGPRNESDVEVWNYFLQKYGHVSWERLISGPGIYDMYLLLRRVSGEKEPEWLKEKLVHEDPAATISDAAFTAKDPVCTETLELFIRFLAIEASQLALKFKATGGIYIGGGILPKIIKHINKEIFQSNFMQSGRLNTLLQMIPVKVILNEKTALLGAAFYGATSFSKK